MKLHEMALRNLGRNRRRTALTALSVGIAMLMVMFLDGFIGGFMTSIVSNYTKNDVGHLNVTTSEYRERERFMPVSAYIRDSKRVIKAIESIPDLKGRIRIIEERIRFGVILNSGSSSKTSLCVAGDPVAEKGLLMLDRSVAQGSYLAKPGDALIGAGIAKDLGLKVGDTLKVVTQKADYGLAFKKFTVSGIFSTNVNSLDGNLFQIGLDDARELLGMAGGATQVIVMLDDYNYSEKAAPLVAAALGKAGLAGLSAIPWTRTGPFASLMVMMSSMYTWIYLIIAFLGAFVIANVMMMAVLERRKEIGILKAMGMPPREILWLFLLEGTMLGLLGSLAGVVLGMALNLVFARVGMDFSGAMASFSWPIDNMIYTTVNWLDALLLVLLGVGVAGAIAFLPSRKAARMDPIEAIRSA
jgi:putative ABC transport system permease protein